MGQAGLATLGLERTTLSNDAWSSGDLYNSLAVRTRAGATIRNYYAEDRVTLRLERLPLVPLIAGESAIAPRLVLLAAHDRSLKAHDVWSLTQRRLRVAPQPAHRRGHACLRHRRRGAALARRGERPARRPRAGAGRRRAGRFRLHPGARRDVAARAQPSAGRRWRSTPAAWPRSMAGRRGSAGRSSAAAPLSRPSPSAPDAATTSPSCARPTPSRCRGWPCPQPRPAGSAAAARRGERLGHGRRSARPGHRTSAPASPCASCMRGSMSIPARTPLRPVFVLGLAWR